MFDVITIGTATRDIFLRSKLFKVLRDPKHLERLGFRTGEAECFALGSKLEIECPVVTSGGGAVNAAITFGRMGFRTAALVRLGRDEFGDAILRHLDAERVRALAVRDKNTGTAHSTVLLTQGGERTILVYRGAAEGLSVKEIPWNSLSARWAYIAPGKIVPRVMRTLIETLKKRGARIAMNPSRYYLEEAKRELISFLKFLDVVVVNREEASYLTGAPYKNERALFKKFDELVSGIAVVTDGARGALVSDGQNLYRAGIFKERALLDRTGAGDAFGSGFVAGLVEKHDIHYALRVASANATSVVEHIGATEGILTKKDFSEKRFQYLDLDVELL